VKQTSRLSARRPAGFAALLLIALTACAARGNGEERPVAAAAAESAPAEVQVGGSFEYEVRPGDSLTSVSARFGLEVDTVARRNGLAPLSWLRIGQRLRIENPHLVPGRLERGILINVPQRMLFLFRGGRVAASFPVGLGRPDWPTGAGSYRVASRVRDKTWYVPPSIQEEMRAQGKPVQTEVPPGPDNPLGGYWLGLQGIACGIHGTIAPSSIYRFRSHGCIRMHPDDVALLFGQVEIGEPVELVYRPLLLATTGEGRVLLEVHRDVYGLAEPPWEALCAQASEMGVAGQLDWARAAEVIAASEGLAREVTASAAGEASGCPAEQAPRKAEPPSQAGSG
jgi:L,D-transpeptidase ErfK/SrfK